MNDLKIKNGIEEVLDLLNLDRMPTSKELRSSGYGWLEALISRNEGFTYWSHKLNLERKENQRKKAYTEKQIINILKNSSVDGQMLSSSEVINLLDGERLHNSIVRSGGYRYYSELLNLKMKESETKLGQDYEYLIVDMLKELNFEVVKMSTKHPFDILINDAIKVDVKVANALVNNKGARSHTFGINKKIW